LQVFPFGVLLDLFCWLYQPYHKPPGLKKRFRETREAKKRFSNTQQLVSPQSLLPRVRVEAKHLEYKKPQQVSTSFSRATNEGFIVLRVGAAFCRAKGLEKRASPTELWQERRFLGGDNRVRLTSPLPACELRLNNGAHRSNP
jgi:hypothetical protein